MKKIVTLCLLAGFVNMCATPVFAGIDMNSAPVAREEVAIKYEQSSVKRSPVRTVVVSDESIIIKEGNVFNVSFAEEFSTKTAEVGDNVALVLNEDFKTVEGTLLLPAGTKINAKVTEIIPTKYWNKNAQAFIELTEIMLPTGQVGEIKANVYSKNSALKKSSWAAAGKVAGYTVGLFGIGTGIGAALGGILSAVSTGCFAIGMPVGGGVGLITGSALKGLNYNAKVGKTIKMQLNEDFEIILKKEHV